METKTKVVGHYELTSKLGSGSYAQVYKGLDTRNGEYFAIKQIAKGL
jgi:serine/threonine protein kinase